MADLTREQIEALRSGERGIHSNDFDRLCAMALRLLDEEADVCLRTVVRGVNDRDTLLRRVEQMEADAKLGAAVRSVLPVHATGTESSADLVEVMAQHENHDGHRRTALVLFAIARALRAEEAPRG